MANRLFDNVIIIDSAMGNLSVVGGASNMINQFKISSIAFWSSTSLGDIVLTGANTATDHITHFSFLAVATNTGIQTSLQVQQFPMGLTLGAIKCPTITAGTGFIYLI